MSSVCEAYKHVHEKDPTRWTPCKEPCAVYPGTICYRWKVCLMHDFVLGKTTGYIDEMKEVVVCENCHNKEYYGMMIWDHGHTYCRACTYKRWRKQSDYNWHPQSNDYVFPLYSDGINYTKEEVSECTPVSISRLRRNLKTLWQRVTKLLCSHQE